MSAKSDAEARDSRQKQDFLDSSQYTLNHVKRYEWVFGTTFLSTELILKDVDLPTGAQVLDVGSGIGGHAFLIAERYGAHVLGIDLSRNMMAVAEDHLSRRPHLEPLVRFEIVDITKEHPDIPDHFFDLVYSRDTFLHIEDKFSLFRRLFTKLKPGGRIIFTDYIHGNRDFDPEYIEYVKQRGYSPATVDKYRKILETSGFVDIKCHDWTHVFKSALESELKRLEEGKQEFLAEFSLQDWNELVDGWRQKLVRVDRGNQAWIFATAVRPAL